MRKFLLSVIAIILIQIFSIQSNLNAQDVLKISAPSSVNFCGEPLPLGAWDVRERFEREFYLNVYDRTQIIIYIKRAGRFFPYLEKRLHEEGLPDDFKYLVVAESALRPVVSPAGAGGFWQLMPAVGRESGLVVNRYIDERYNLEKATAAGIKHLKDSYKRFQPISPDYAWTLSAAGYNQGRYGVSDDMAFQWATNPYDLYQNDETSRYVFRIVAIKEIMTHPQKYGIYVDDVYQPIETKEIEVKAEIKNLALWAKKQGTTFKEVKLLNPWIRQRSVPLSPKGYKILIPKNASPQDFDDSIYKYKELNINESEPLKTVTYTVREGDTLERIADHYGISPETILKDNKLQSRLLEVGQRLIIRP
jgi:membrane-bound lytic murein transglycosylase D